MSGPDEGMLTAQERAALASLEARAVADDPGLASHLRGLRSKERLRGLPKRDLTWATSAASRFWLSMRPAVWGPLLTVAGLVVVVLGLAVSLALSVLGVALAVTGLGLSARLAAGRLERFRDEQAHLRGGPSPD